MNVNEKLKAIIEERNIPISYLAKLLGITRNTVYNYIKSEKPHPIDVNLLIDISKKLNIPLSYFFDEDILKSTDNKTMDVLKELDKTQDEVREYSFQIRLLLNYIYSIGIAYYKYIESLSPEAKEAFLKTDLSRDILNSLEINKESLNDLSSWARELSKNSKLREK